MKLNYTELHRGFTELHRGLFLSVALCASSVALYIIRFKKNNFTELHREKNTTCPDLSGELHRDFFLCVTL